MSYCTVHFGSYPHHRLSLTPNTLQAHTFLSYQSRFSLPHCRISPLYQRPVPVLMIRLPFAGTLSSAPRNLYPPQAIRKLSRWGASDMIGYPEITPHYRPSSFLSMFHDHASAYVRLHWSLIGRSAPAATGCPVGQATAPGNTERRGRAE